MPRRSEFKGIAKNLAEWCLCRNNDYLGYWAIGQLYNFSQNQRVSVVSVDVLATQFVPENKELSILCSGFYEIVKKQMLANSMPNYWLKSLQIKFHFEAPYQDRYHYFGSAIGKPMVCSVVILTDLGREYFGESGCNCRPHNPARESRRHSF